MEMMEALGDSLPRADVATMLHAGSSLAALRHHPNPTVAAATLRLYKWCAFFYLGVFRFNLVDSM
jgi:hypothetical protein